MYIDSDRELSPEERKIIKFLASGKNMDEAPLANPDFRDTSKVKPAESPDIEAESVVEYIGKGHNRDEMPLAPEESLNGARR